MVRIQPSRNECLRLGSGEVTQVRRGWMWVRYPSLSSGRALRGRQRRRIGLGMAERGQSDGWARVPRCRSKGVGFL